MEKMKEAAEKLLHVIKAELEPHGFKIGAKGVHVYHKTHAAPRDGCAAPCIALQLARPPC